MKTTRIMAIAGVIVRTDLALRAAQAGDAERTGNTGGHGSPPLACARERTYLEHFWNDFPADPKHSVSEKDRHAVVKARDFLYTEYPKR